MSALFPSVVLVGVSLGVASIVLALLWVAIKISSHQRQRRGY